MKTKNLLAIMLAILLNPVQCRPAIPAKTESKMDNTQALVMGNTTFALDLYSQLKDEKGNLFFSPFSISTALAMTYAGARGDTEEQMARVLHFMPDQSLLHPAFGRLLVRMNVIEKKGIIDLIVANTLWAQKDYRFLPGFIDLVKNIYQSELKYADFKTDCQAARKAINTWVEQKTKDKIKDLIKPGVLDAYTRLVLVNAIYFNGKWANQFDQNLTKDALFRPAPGKSLTVPMMNQQEEFGYAETDSLQILKMPYAGDDLSMIVLLPRKNDGLDVLERALTMSNLKKWTENLRKREVQVFLPKFKMSSQFRLEKKLAAMGMIDAFNMKADFSGMDGTKDLYIFAVIHKAFVDVTEEGTEAAAATAVVMRMKAMPVQPPVFRADHPFVFMIRDNRSGSILFLGRVVDPVSSIHRTLRTSP